MHATRSVHTVLSAAAHTMASRTRVELLSAHVCGSLFAASVPAQPALAAAAGQRLKIAAVVTEYRKYSHAQVKTTSPLMLRDHVLVLMGWGAGGGRPGGGGRGLSGGGGVCAPACYTCTCDRSLMHICMGYLQHICDRFLMGMGWGNEHHYPEVDLVGIYIAQDGAGHLGSARESAHCCTGRRVGGRLREVQIHSRDTRRGLAEDRLVVPTSSSTFRI